jgi:polysaccharide biosynthesis protein PslH
VDQLLRFYEVHVLSPGTQSQAETFKEAFGGQLAGFDFAVTRQSRGAKFVHKAWRTFTSRCDFLPSLETNFRWLCTQITSRQSFDAVILSTVLLRNLPLPREISVVADTHNVEFDVHAQTSVLAETFARRAYARWQILPTFREERRCAHNVDLLLANSEWDRQLFEEKLNVRKVEVIPNGIDIDEFSPATSSGRPGTILFTGLMSYYPNQQAIRWFLDAVFPLVLARVPEARLIVAGARPPAWLVARRSRVVEVTGSLLDIRPYFEQASVVIAPLMIGGGTRVKILEAQAMKRPVVSTSAGANGLDVRNGHSILLANDAESFAMQVARLLTDRNLASEIAANARREVVPQYDWNRIGERLESVLRETLGLVPRDVRERRASCDLVASSGKA